MSEETGERIPPLEKEAQRKKAATPRGRDQTPRRAE